MTNGGWGGDSSNQILISANLFATIVVGACRRGFSAEGQFNYIGIYPLNKFLAVSELVSFNANSISERDELL